VARVQRFTRYRVNISKTPVNHRFVLHMFPIRAFVTALAEKSTPHVLGIIFVDVI